MIETVGKVVLDLSKYPGQDFYSEGADEDVLLSLVKEHSAKDYNKLIAQKANWSVLYHLSDLRGNIVDFLPFSKKDKVLEVGAGCGAITGSIAKKAGSVTCIELSKKRSLINANRNRDCDNVEIKVGNFQDVETDLPCDYDYIMLIGVFEYAASYINSPAPYETFLNILLSHLKKGGKLVIAIENKYGLKYFAGCREDHLGSFYGGIEGYEEKDHVRTFSRDKLVALAKNAGCSVMEYYPYPDYKLPVTIYSADRLPKRGELSGQVPNFDYARFVAFDEEKAFNELIDDGMFPFFSNSFLMMLQKGECENREAKVIYSKHSNERSDAYAIRTDIEVREDGKLCVVKYPLTDQASTHINSLKEKYNLLLKQYAGSIFVPNRYVDREDAAEFEYLTGDTLTDVLTKLIEAGMTDKVYEILDLFVKTVKNLPGTGENQEFFEVTNLDLIFDNIIPDTTTSSEVSLAKWHIVDYEWTFKEKYEKDFVIYRAFRYFISACSEAKALDLYGRYNISEEKQKLYSQKENSLQEMIAGDRTSLIGFYSIFGADAFKLSNMYVRSTKLPRMDRVRVFYDLGNGFNENDARYYFAKLTDEDKLILDFPILEGTRALRIDPTEEPCVLSVDKLSLDDSENIEEVYINGIQVEQGVIYYNAPDPQILIMDDPEKTQIAMSLSNAKQVHVEYGLTAFNQKMFEAIGRALTPKEEETGLKSIFRKKKVKAPYEKVRI